MLSRLTSKWLNCRSRNNPLCWNELVLTFSLSKILLVVLIASFTIDEDDVDEFFSRNAEWPTKGVSLIYSRAIVKHSCHIPDTPLGRFELAQNLCSGLVEWSCAVVITTTHWRRNSFKLFFSLRFHKVIFIDCTFVASFTI